MTAKNRKLMLWAALAAGAWWLVKNRTAAVAPAIAPAEAQTSSVSPTNAPTTANMQGLAYADTSRHNSSPYIIG